METSNRTPIPALPGKGKHLDSFGVIACVEVEADEEKHSSAISEEKVPQKNQQENSKKIKEPPKRLYSAVLLSPSTRWYYTTLPSQLALWVLYTSNPMTPSRPLSSLTPPPLPPRLPRHLPPPRLAGRHSRISFHPHASSLFPFFLPSHLSEIQSSPLQPFPSACVDITWR